MLAPFLESLASPPEFFGDGRLGRRSKLMEPRNFQSAEELKTIRPSHDQFGVSRYLPALVPRHCQALRGFSKKRLGAEMQRRTAAAAEVFSLKSHQSKCFVLKAGIPNSRRTPLTLDEARLLRQAQEP